MAIPILLLPLLAAAAPTGGPVVVTGFAWAPFISPMGEAFRARTPAQDTLADWFNQADRNHDGFLSVDEMVADADRFFKTLDTDHSGQIEPDELVRYEWQLAPEIQVNAKRKRARGEKVESGPASPFKTSADGLSPDLSQGRRNREEGLELGPEGAARYALLNIPEPVAAADADFNRAISAQEFKKAAVERFHLLDRAGTGKLSLDSLRPLLPEPPSKHARKRSKHALDTRVGQPMPPEVPDGDQPRSGQPR